MEMTKIGTVEYKMPQQTTKELLKMPKSEETKMTSNELVNEQYGLLGQCVRIIKY